MLEHAYSAGAVIISLLAFLYTLGRNNNKGNKEDYRREMQDCKARSTLETQRIEARMAKLEQKQESDLRDITNRLTEMEQIMHGHTKTLTEIVLNLKNLSDRMQVPYQTAQVQ